MIFISHTGIIDDKAMIVDIKGALDSSTSTDFEEYINQLLAKKKVNVIMNAEKVEYISSAGIGVILYIQKKILALRGIFILCAVPDEIQALFNLLGFDKIIRTAVDKAEAIQIIDKHFKLTKDIQYEEIQPHIIENTADELNKKISETETSVITDYNKDEDGDKAFENPIILECSKCKSMIRVKKSGNYICPDCKTEFYVDSDQTVVF